MSPSGLPEESTRDEFYSIEGWLEKIQQKNWSEHYKIDTCTYKNEGKVEMRMEE